MQLVVGIRTGGDFKNSGIYTPKAGDLILFKTSRTSVIANHIGIVRYVNGGRVYTVEGNASDAVIYGDYALSATRIVGYGTY